METSIFVVNLSILINHLADKAVCPFYFLPELFGFLNLFFCPFGFFPIHRHTILHHHHHHHRSSCSSCLNSCTLPLLSIIRALYIRRYSPDDDRVFRQQHYDDEYDHYRDYWQRSAFGPGMLAGRSRTPVALRARTEDTFQSRVPEYTTVALGPSTISADVHHDDVQYWRLRDAHHTATSTLWAGGQSADDRPVPPPRRRAMKNIQFSVESGLAHSILGQKFPSQKAKHLTDSIVHNYDLTPSNQASVRGSFRSDGSGQSQVRRPYSQLSYAESNATRTPSKLEVQFPPPQLPPPLPPSFTRSTLNASLPLRPQTLLPYQRQMTASFQNQDGQLPVSVFRPQEISGLPSRLQELPVLCPIHDVPVGQAFPRPSLGPDGRFSNLRATVPIGRSISQFPPGRVLHKRPPLLEPVPEAIYDSTNQAHTGKLYTILIRVINWHFFWFLVVQPQRLYQNLPVPLHLLLGSGPPPLKPRLRVAPPVPPRPVEQKPNTSPSDSSSERQFEYTRDQLLGAVEKVRSGYLLSRSSPYRHTTEGKCHTIFERLLTFDL